MAEDVRQAMKEDVREAKDFLQNRGGSPTEAPSAIVKISKAGTAITKSTIDKFADCVPIRYFKIPMFVTPPNANASGGAAGGGDFELGFVTFAVDLNADIGDTAGCFFQQNDMSLGILELTKADGGFAPLLGYEFTNCRIVNLPQTYLGYRIIVVRVQNIKFVENSFGPDGKKSGKKASGEFDAAKGK